mmetsp:Transcript_4977/g.11364  ORF Transcript_4977/g.11364 Transcript_4977/m.11364 type:complete len:80 (-) Transcript_4977:1520-1759(-)
MALTQRILSCPKVLSVKTTATPAFHILEGKDGGKEMKQLLWPIAANGTPNGSVASVFGIVKSEITGHYIDKRDDSNKGY